VTEYSKRCKASGELFTISASEAAFYDKCGPIFNGRKYPLPLPTHSPTERVRRRLAIRNERHLERTRRLNPRKLWERKCAKTGVPIVTTYPPDADDIVYSEKAFKDFVYNEE